METIVKAVALFLVFAVVLGVIGVICTYPVMWLMNYTLAPSLLVALFGVGKMTLWRTLAFVLLVGLLQKGSSTTEKK